MKIIPYVLTWEGLVTKYHKKHRSEIGINTKTEAYIQSLVLKKTLESISFDRRRGLEEEDGHNDVEVLMSKLTKVELQANNWFCKISTIKVSYSLKSINEYFNRVIIKSLIIYLLIKPALFIACIGLQLQKDLLWVLK